ncbi:probable serine/threonine kinase protein with two-component sensor domain [Plesiocystis pacifica SIR-1]|uniref:histidine kinase n=1 Tax=Plesiocystis pacifica SIR-1 TaxID=391625 RepID=A6GFS9_9BACT|nr:probable serine/threonine kinase protein with two-component sensor domain [Plesiocystis pacifica SIR-1]
MRSSASERVYELERNDDGRRVLARVFPALVEGVEAQARREFRVLAELDVEGVVRPLALERVGDRLVLLLDQVEGTDLRTHSHGQALGLQHFLDIASRLVRVLAEVHERGVIHRALQPSKMLLDRNTGAVYLAEFGFSALIEAEHRRLHEPEVFAGTLPYISPEQTGRTAREVDFRSDLYSLGVSFYELLTGRLPFEAAAPIELVHAHLARSPTPLRHHRAGLPERLETMVAKLLEKAPERRYQSARGLLADLDELRAAVDAGEPERPFVLARHDYPATLQFPRTLYGREATLALLERRIADLAVDAGALRERSVVLLEGDAGMGKSALVNALEGPLLARGGYLARGAFEQRESLALYSALSQAFEGLLQQLFTEDEHALRGWQARIRQGLGPIAGALRELLPSLELILERFEPLPPLPAAETQNRLHLAFRRLLSVLAEGCPLVLAIEDLQWADPASLALLSTLALDEGAPSMILLTRRPPARQGPDTHEVLRVTTAKATLRLRLDALDGTELRTLLRDTLGHGASEDALAALAELVTRRTGNNPLLIRELLSHLFSQRLLVPGPGGWTWDLDALSSASEASLPEDVVGLLTLRLRSLPDTARALVSEAALLGHRVDIELLGAISRLDEDAQWRGLERLQSDGILDPTPEGYCFAHAELMRVARDLAPEHARRELHGDIGRALIASLGDGNGRGLGERLFEVAEHLDASAGLSATTGAGSLVSGEGLTQAERRSQVTVFLEAANRALSNANWSVARRYFIAARKRLGADLDAADAGRAPTPEVFQAVLGEAQTRALSGDSEGAQTVFAVLERWPLEPAQYAAVVARRLRALTMLQRTAEAIAYGREALRRFGVRLPRTISRARIGLEAARGWIRCRAITREQWLAMPALDDPKRRAISAIVDALKAPAYLVDKPLFVVLASLHVRVAARGGVDESAAVALSQLAIAVNAGLRRPEAAAQLCDHAMALCSRPALAPARPRVEAAARLFVWPASRAWRDAGADLDRLITDLAEIGERQLGGYAIVMGVAQLFETGVPLSHLLELGRRWQREVNQWGTAEMALGSAKTLRLAGLLAGEVQSFEMLISHEQGARIHASPVFMATSVACRMVAHILIGDPRKAHAEFQTIAESYARDLFGSWQSARIAMWAAIADVAELEADPHAPTARALRSRLSRYPNLLRSWASGCPENFEPMLELSLAEQHRGHGRVGDAFAAYSRVRSLASAQSNLLLEGLASMRMADLGVREDRLEVAHGARDLALRAFKRWGGHAVVVRLEQARAAAGAEASELGRLLLESDPDTGSSSKLAIPSAASSGNSPIPPGVPAMVLGSSSGALELPVPNLELRSVFEITRQINEELGLEQVISRVLDSAVTNAGAERGALLLEQRGAVRLVAESDAQGTRACDLPLDRAQDRLPMSAVHYVLRSGSVVVVDDLEADPRFGADPHVRDQGVRSLLCMPIVKRRRRVGALVLESCMSSHAFTRERLAVLEFIANQAASALDNARLYRALEHSEVRWRSLVNGAPDSIVVLDTEGRVEFINHLIGVAVDRALDGEPFERVIPKPEDRARWRELLAKVVASGRTQELELTLDLSILGSSELFEEDSQIRLRPGLETRRSYVARVAPVDAQGKRLLAIATDVSRRKALEAQVRQQQRLESIGTLASGVAHEINNPIQGIMNYAELIATRPQLDPMVLDFAREIGAETERVSQIIRDMLTFARRDSEAEREWAAPKAIVASTLSLVHAIMRKSGMQVMSDLPSDLPEVYCRPQQIRQILVNLLTNARDALGELPAKTLDADNGLRRRIDLRVLVRERAEQRWLRFEVEDHGPGMPPEVQAHIFDPFFTTKSRDRGTGLGLAVSHGIAVEHGGKLEVTSELGAGTTFRLSLPLEPQPSAAAQRL